MIDGVETIAEVADRSLVEAPGRRVETIAEGATVVDEVDLAEAEEDSVVEIVVGSAVDSEAVETMTDL